MMSRDVIQKTVSHTETQAAMGQNRLYSEVALAKPFSFKHAIGGHDRSYLVIISHTGSHKFI